MTRRAVSFLVVDICTSIESARGILSAGTSLSLSIYIQLIYIYICINIHVILSTFELSML